MCDSSAALGVIERKGVGEIRHLDVGKLWIQELREEGGVTIKKVKGTANPADQLTKHLIPREVEKGLELCGMERREGRAKRTVRLQGGETGKTEGSTPKKESQKNKNVKTDKTQRRRKRRSREEEEGRKDMKKNVKFEEKSGEEEEEDEKSGEWEDETFLKNLFCMMFCSVTVV